MPRFRFLGPGLVLSYLLDEAGVSLCPHVFLAATSDYAESGLCAQPRDETMGNMALDITAAAIDPALLDLPWDVPLEEWPSNLSRHCPAAFPATLCAS